MFQKSLLLLLTTLILSACQDIPEKIKPVSNFDLKKYQGTWYEIARLDHGFEEGLEAVTAKYVIRDDGKVDVLNNGFETQANEWDDAQGVARMKGQQDVGHLEVSFFGPFYANYMVFYLDPEYKYSYVSGGSYSYLWFLSRTPTVSQAQIDHFKAKAVEVGYDLTDLIIVNQAKNTKELIPVVE